MKKLLTTCILCLLLLFSCGKSTPLDPIVLTQEISVESAQVICINNSFYINGNSVMLQRTMVNYDTFEVKIRKPGVIIFNEKAEIKIGLGSYLKTSDGSTLPSLSFTTGVASVEMDSVLNLDNTLYALSIGYWDSEETTIEKVAQRFVDIYISSLSKVASVVELNDLAIKR